MVMQTRHRTVTPIGMWQPLHHTRFRRLWLANAGSNLGSVMQTFGVLADSVDRVGLQFCLNAAMAGIAVCAAALLLADAMSPTALLAMTFLMATGSAFLWPAWQANLADLLPPQELPAVASLNNLSLNSAALLGACLGAVILAWLGSWTLFAINAISYIGLLSVYRQWHRRGVTCAPAPQRRNKLQGVAGVFRTPGFRPLLTLAGGQALGSVVWGWAADQWGVALAWWSASALILACSALTSVSPQGRLRTDASAQFAIYTK